MSIRVDIYFQKPHEKRIMLKLLFIIELSSFQWRTINMRPQNTHLITSFDTNEEVENVARFWIEFEMATGKWNQGDLKDAETSKNE
jgi:hypothetical protein